MTAIISIPLTLGVLLHMLLDYLFYPGIKLFYPFREKEYYFYRGKFKKYHQPRVLVYDFIRSKQLFAETFLFVISLVIT
jgi:membrane-bound metal-dependent hydrolase YbcI (DUF457 family)